MASGTGFPWTRIWRLSPQRNFWSKKALPHPPHPPHKFGHQSAQLLLQSWFCSKHPSTLAHFLAFRQLIRYSAHALLFFIDHALAHLSATKKQFKINKSFYCLHGIKGTRCRGPYRNFIVPPSKKKRQRLFWERKTFQRTFLLSPAWIRNLWLS